MGSFEFARIRVQSLTKLKMKAFLKKVASRAPFRPFMLRLSNGAKYEFTESRQFGAPQDLHVICFFGPKEFVLIYPDEIVEVQDIAA